MTARYDEFEIRPRGDTGPAPLSYAQELLWLMDRASPGLTAWNAPRAMRLRGSLDVPALRAAIAGLVSRHDVFRTTFGGPESAPRQIVHPSAKAPLEELDLRGLPAAEATARSEQLVREHARAHFDLSRDPLFRALLITLADDEHLLAINSHHIVFDGWSRSVMLRDLSALYQAARRDVPAPLDPLPIQYADYAAWERSPAHEAALAHSLAYWREQLAGALPALDLPTDRPRPQARSFEGEREVLHLSPALVHSVGAVAKAEGVTPYMVLLAAYVTLLHRYTGQDEVIVGSPIAGRMQGETEGLIGFFANTLVLRCRAEGSTPFSDLLAQVRDTALSGYEHQEVPFERLVLELQQDRQLSHAPLFQAVLTMEDTVPAALELDGVAVETLGAELGAAKFDLTLLVAQQADGLRLSLWYRTDLHDAATARQMLRHFEAILTAATAAPATPIGDLPMVAGDELAAILAASTGPAASLPSATISDQVAAAAARSPEVVAVRSGTSAISYAELDRAANRLAHYLRSRGVVRGDSVGICLERSVDSLVALLAVMRSGGAYVWLLPELPTPRLAQQVIEAGVRLVVADAGRRAHLPADVDLVLLDNDAAAVAAMPDAMPDAQPSLDDLAYILFTSGSTGTPKGVAITHANLAHYTAAIISRLELDGVGGLGFASVSTLAADLGHTTLFPALVSGGTLHLIATEVSTDAARFGEYVHEHPIDVLKITPNHLRALLSGPRGPEALPRRWVVLGGEACSWELADELLRAGRCRVLNHYGPTETTVGCCTFEVTSESARTARAAGAQTVPIGRPLAGVRAYVADARGHLVPRGVAGELLIGGRGVSAGYVNRPELTAERFSADPLSSAVGDRVYHSGDRVRRLGTGDLEFLGRTDDQVKIRGYRVEPGEIAQLLGAHPAVQQAAVIARRASASEEPVLVGYVVARSAGYAAAHTERPTPERLMQYLAERLPDYMVPSHVMLLDAMPLGANGKLDRGALPDPAATAAADLHVEPATATEIAVAQIWSDVLKRDRVGATDNFLVLGGHSLLAIRVLGRISKQLGVRLPLRTLFEAPTVTALAAVIDDAQQAKEAELLAALADVEGMSDSDVTRGLQEPGAAS